MSAHVACALNLLSIVRQETDAIGVAVSFGKDSLATLDLCCRVFPRVEGFYLHRVRGLAVVEEWARQVYERHGVIVRMYPHFDLVRCYRHAVLQPHWRGLDQVPRIGMDDIEAAFRREACVDWIAYGWRRNDSFSRALIMRRCRGIDWDARRVFPLRAFTREFVYRYLRSRSIPEPPRLGRREQGGLDFVPAALRWLRERYPDDYARWLVDFPFSEMQILAPRGGSRSR
jgi:3'-phosphoadenosine 5'-phosphosulfate sulfotransferase (PAPS reductase)/FAD synthetase